MDFWNVLLEVLVLLMMGYCLLHICRGGILGVVLPLLKLFYLFQQYSLFGYMNEVDLDGDFPLLFIFKALNCSTAVALCSFV